MKKFLCITLCLLFLGLTACFNTESETSSSKYEFVGKVDMQVDYDSYLGYSVEIKGKLKNTSSREFSYVSVTFAIYDEDGNQLETALDNMNYLQPGETWQFSASLIGWTEIQPKSCKLVDVKAW